jgi:hypothetical protein
VGWARNSFSENTGCGYPVVSFHAFCDGGLLLQAMAQDMGQMFQGGGFGGIAPMAGKPVSRKAQVWLALFSKTCRISLSVCGLVSCTLLWNREP